MKTIEKSARTQEEAIQAALEELNASISDVDVKVLDEGSKGLFGLFGSRLARVQVTLKSSDLESEIESMITDTPVAPVKESVQPEEAPAAAPAVEAPAKEVKAEEAPAAPVSRMPEPVRRTRNQPKEKKPEQPRENRREPKSESKPLPPKEPVKPLEKPEVTYVDVETLDPQTPIGKAYAFLSELTSLMGVNVTIEMGNDADGNVYGKMHGDTLGILIGRRGETLDAIQYLTSLKVNRGQENYTRVTLDTEDYRARREETLIRLANRMANRAVKTGRRVNLEPMNPYERRIIHSALQANDAVDTHSEGEEPNRHVVITVRR
ncbi:MAG: Jag N-terminal domain-containing protein [Clostridia bacterium]|nr:Jag N-terminal domain-containing protein [Clostridia bacterium]MBR2287724.1 Jag N-terminal domain-containing protein [Clostridia bacterium]